MTVITLNNIKQSNLSRALRHFCESDELSRREVAALMNCDHATATRVVKTLLEQGFLEDAGKRELKHGRPREMLKLHTNAPVGIGLELHSNAVAGVTSNLRGRSIRSCWREFDPEGGRAAFVRAFRECVELLTENLEQRIFGCALAGIGTLTGDGAVISDCANFPALNGFDLQKFWVENFTLPEPCFTDRMLAEMHWFLAHDPALRSGTFVLVNAGRGIGMATACDGKITTLNRRHGGEFGHNTVVPGGSLCRCGRRGCLEAYASVGKLLELTSCNELEALQKRSGESAVTGILENAAGLFAQALANQINNLLPEHVVITGELITLGESFNTMLQQKLQQNLFAVAANGLDLIFHSGSADAAAGAVCMARESYLESIAQGASL